MAARALLIALLMFALAAPAAPVWSWPVDSRDVARGFEAPPQPWAAGHRGIDIRATDSAVIVAPAEGVVRFAGYIVDRGVVSIDHGEGVLSSYEPVAALVAEGDPVVAGQPIAVLTKSLHGCSSCLHFGVRIAGEYVDPLTLLPLARPVLLPVSGARMSAPIGLTKSLE